MMPGLLVLGDAPEEGVGKQAGFPLVPLHSGSRFAGHQQSKGNKYQVEVVFKVRVSEGQRRRERGGMKGGVLMCLYGRTSLI